jgi:hypothetical protein
MNKKKNKNNNDWTIMVYLGGNNNLGDEMVWALKDMQAWRLAVKLSKARNPRRKIKVLALLDVGGPAVDLDIGELDVRQTKGEDAPTTDLPKADEIPDGLVLTRTIKVREEADQARARKRSNEALAVPPVTTTLKTFLEKCIDGHEAKHYMIVLSGHGSGAVGDFLTADERPYGLTIPALGKVLREVMHKKLQGRKFDVLGLDSCQMSMAEVACEVQEAVDFMVGSEGFQPNAGWPYEQVLALLSNPTIVDNPGRFAENIVREHIGYYLDYAAADLSTDISAMNLHHFGDLKHALSVFTNELGIKHQDKEFWSRVSKLPRPELAEQLNRMVKQTLLSDQDLKDAIVLAHWEAQGYKREQYVDLWDFFNCLSRRLNLLKETDKYNSLKKACEAIKSVIEPNVLSANRNDRLVRLSGYSGPQFQHSHGISIFLPWAELTDASGIPDLVYYQTLEFAATAWDEFILLYLHVTQRDVRTENTTGRDYPSLLNRRTGLFIQGPGKGDPDFDPYRGDPDFDPYRRTGLGTAKFESMKNPPIEWKKWFVNPTPTKHKKKAAGQA